MKIIEAQLGTLRANVMHATCNTDDLCVPLAGWNDLLSGRVITPIVADILWKGLGDMELVWVWVGIEGFAQLLDLARSNLVVLLYWR